MKKEDFVKLGIPEDLAEKAAEASAEELKGFIPKTRFDEVNTAKKNLELEVAKRDEQLEALKKVDVAGLQQQIETLQAENKTAKEKYEAELKKVQLDNAVEKALLSAKAKNTKAARALLAEFLDKAELDGEVVKGLDEEIQKLVQSEDTKFLFDTEPKANNGLRGVKPGEKADGTPHAAAPSTLRDAVQASISKTQ